MPTSVVTKDKGGKTRIMPMTVAEPDRVMKPEQLESFAQDARANGRFLADQLSAFAAHERCGLHLYRTLAGLTQNAAHKAKYEEFGRETEEHIDVYESLIKELGGDPMYVSPAARLTEYADAKLLEPLLLTGSIDLKTQEMFGIEAVLLAETKCHGNWELLKKLSQLLPEQSKARKAMEAAVQKVEQEEDEHLNWAKQAREQMVLGLALER